jgi:hypothetical protein
VSPPHLNFVRRLPVTLALAMALWFILRPVIDGAVTAGAEILIRTHEVPKTTRLIVADHRAEIHRTDFRSGSAIPTVGLTEIHFNLIVLLALCFALPRPTSRLRLERLFMCVCVLYLTQVVNLLFHVKTTYALGLGEWSMQHYSDAARNLYGFGRYFTDLPGRFAFPFLIWLGFNWEAVTGMLAPGASREPSRRNRTDSPKPSKRKKRSRRSR